MKFRTWIGLSLASIVLITASPFTQPLHPVLVALAEQVRTYGVDGSTGRDGRDGSIGPSGQPQTLQVDGSPQQVNGSGGGGRDGEDGGTGDHPTCPVQPRNVSYDLQAPNGGDGGDGGNGGNGGDGGDVTLYYPNPADLRQIWVNAQGGPPGQAGRGGRGGDGCRCDHRDWQVQVCTNGNCQQQRFICRDGDSGRDGRDGDDGEPGRSGQLWLVNQLDPLSPEIPTLTQPLATLLSQPVQLSKNIWQSRTGAGALLASGSIVADVYQQYVGRVETLAQLSWQADRPQTEFLTFSPTLSLDVSGNLQVEFPEALWVDGQQQITDNLRTYNITHIALADSVTRLSWGNQSGQGRNFTVTIVDLGAESAYLNTQFELIYSTADGDPHNGRRIRYVSRYQGNFPSELVTRDNNRFGLALGRLPVSDRYFQPGTYAQMELRIVRSLGHNTATQTLSWNGQL